eukprot:scaffold43802_cov204-Skeletonema_marinoi.AAC.1
MNQAKISRYIVSGTALEEPLDALERAEGEGRGDSLGTQDAKVVFKKRTVNVKECQRTLMSKSTVTYATLKNYFSSYSLEERRSVSVEKGELKPRGAGKCPKTPVGPAEYGFVAVGGWQTLWCRRGRTVEGSESSEWVWYGVGITVVSAAIIPLSTLGAIARHSLDKNSMPCPHMKNRVPTCAE